MKSVYKTPILADAVIVKDMLVENGVEAKVVEGNSPYPSTATLASEVWIIRDEDDERATRLIRELEHARQSTPPQWTCGQCRETNPGEFEVCWNCGTARRE